MHASHSCLIVTEMLENELAEIVEPEPGVEFVFEPKKPRQVAKHVP
jgi:hypothetical protein